MSDYLDEIIKGMWKDVKPSEDCFLNHIDPSQSSSDMDMPFFPNDKIQFADFPKEVDYSLKREVDLERIKETFNKNTEYPDNLVYPFDTHKGSQGNCTELLWVCENCGYTSYFTYRSDLVCSDAIFFCNNCKTSQCLNYKYAGEDKILDLKCVARCRRDDGLVPFSGKVCPICGGKIVQFNGIRLKREYLNYNYNDATKQITIMDTINSKDKKD